MTAPGWIGSLVGEFGRSAGIRNFALNAQGVAAISFETGLSLRFEYVEGSLVISVTVPAPATDAAARSLLSRAHPDARFGLKVRAGWLARSSRAVFAIRLAEREVTLPAINAAFNALWRIGMEYGGETWA